MTIKHKTTKMTFQNNNYKHNVENRNVRAGIIYITVVLFIYCALIFRDSTVPGLFTSSSNNSNVSMFAQAFAFCSDIVIQFFGTFSYVALVVLIVRGMSFFCWNRTEFKYQSLWVILFLILGCVLFNVASTYPVFKDILSSKKFECYAGGYIGYAFSKLIFINIFHQKQVYGWQFGVIFIILFWSLQYICCFYYTETFKYVKKAKPKWLITRLTQFLKIFTLKAKLKAKILWSKSLEKMNKKKQQATVHPSEVLERQYKALSISLRQQLKPDETHGTEENTIEEDLIHSKSRIKTNEVRQQDIQDVRMRSSDLGYVLPSVDLLNKHEISQNYENPELFRELSNELIRVLEEFSIKGEIIKVKPGPIVTMFEFKPAPGIKTSRIISLSDDIARSMSAFSARISTIPGRNAIGIELPNQDRHGVYLSELISSPDFINKQEGIQLVLGKDTSGNAVLTDLTKMPHLLIAGTTGSGKSVSINGMILSILFKFKPNECKLIMIDPKMLELSVYDNIPHLLTPVVTDPNKAVLVLKWTVSEMERRYQKMAKLGSRNIDGFNQKVRQARENPELLVRKIQIGFDPRTNQPIFESQKLDFDTMPYIVVVVDEMADLMLVAGKEVESAIQRLAQMARAAGIHLIMATQRPSVDVITGTIKANFPTRISFQVTSKIDSRTILGEQGAEQLLGQGDMLYMSGAGRLLRVHGSFVDDTEIDRVVDFIKSQELPQYVDITAHSPIKTLADEQLSAENYINEVTTTNNHSAKRNNKKSKLATQPIPDVQSKFAIRRNSDNNEDETLYYQAVELVRNDHKYSANYIQRKLKIGYMKAEQLVNEMEKNGVLSAPDKAGKRRILP